jgi:uncharacterized protein
MQISLHKLNQAKDGQLDLHETVTLDALPGEVPGLVRLEPVQVNARVSLLDPHLIEAETEQSTQATFSCSKCLSEFVLPIRVNWKEYFTDEAHRSVESE